MKIIAVMDSLIVLMKQPSMYLKNFWNGNLLVFLIYFRSLAIFILISQQNGGTISTYFLSMKKMWMTKSVNARIII